jgi:hypothetical protein
MNTLEKYAPSFYGKDATEKLNTWTTLLSNNDFPALVGSHEVALATYIAALRKAEIFEKCTDATAALQQLKEFLCWDEDYSVDYCVMSSLSYYCKTVDEFVAHSSHKEWVDQSWVVNEFYQRDGGNSLDWEVRDSWGEKHPGDVRVTSLALVDASPVTLQSAD